MQPGMSREQLGRHDRRREEDRRIEQEDTEAGEGERHRGETAGEFVQHRDRSRNIDVPEDAQGDMRAELIMEQPGNPPAGRDIAIEPLDHLGDIGIQGQRDPPSHNRSSIPEGQMAGLSLA
jgi:hypothetical protein